MKSMLIPENLKEFVNLTNELDGQPCLRMCTPLASATIALQGAQVLSFAPKGKQNLLWLSEKAVTNGSQAIRGGTPICWPWFGAHSQNPQLPQHGFARISLFQLESVSYQQQALKVSLSLVDSAATRAFFDYRFKLTVEITMTDSLTISLVTENNDEEAFHISEAIHSYFNVGDIHQTELVGLQGLAYFDQLRQLNLQEQAPLLSFDQEIDRIYLLPQEQLIVKTPLHTISVHQRASNACVVWNPWKEKAKRMTDFGDAEYLKMLCVESANIKPPILIQPGSQHRLTQMIELNELSL
ncbi:D-hexose-6-phosphate mutarotase [Aliikangiella sp. IMCC44632]